MVAGEQPGHDRPVELVDDALGEQVTQQVRAALAQQVSEAALGQ
jgi:hypothetical protein